METTSALHSEAAAILMDVSQQPIADVLQHDSQAASILMNVSQAKATTVETKADEGQIVLDNKTSKIPEEAPVITMETQEYPVSVNIDQNVEDIVKTEALADTYLLSDPAETSMKADENQQFKVMSNDGQCHTITVAGFEEKISESGEVQRLSMIQVDTPGRETELITVSGLADNCSLESLAEIAEIVVNSADRNSGVNLMENIPEAEAVETVPDSQYIAMKESQVEISVEGHEDISKSVIQTINLDSNPGSQNLVSLAQIAELVINQGGLEGEGSTMQELQIGSDANNQPILISGLDTNIVDVQTVSATQKKTLESPNKQYIRVPLKANDPNYVPIPTLASRNQPDAQSSYVTTILPDSRRNPPKSSASKNIYSKIKAENGECYMVVLPESNPLNPAQLHNLLKSYSSEGKSVAKPANENKPQMFSAGSQTNRKRRSILKSILPGIMPREKTEIVVCHPPEPKGIGALVDGSCQVDPELLAASSLISNDVQVKVEPMDEEGSLEKASTEDIIQDFESNNCGHEVAPKRTESDGPRPDMVNSMVQTDVTASCYLNITAEEASIHRKKGPRIQTHRKYLDDDFETTECSPFLERKSLLDIENAFYICGVCDVKYKTAEEMKMHAKAHKPKKASCPSCKKKCANLKVLADHVISHTRCKSFKCCVCTADTVFTTAEDFKAHVKEHLNDRFFICGSCKQKFLHVANLRVHMRIHTGEKPFECDKCSSSFSQKASLESHLSSFHNNEKPFTCDQCGNKFARKTDLRIHLRKHSGERPYSCDICEKTFTSNSGLTSHKKTHYRKRFHQCMFCTKSFDTPARLKKHAQTWHEGDKALRCRICSRSFTNLAELREHQENHSDAPFPCVTCSFGSTNKTELASHIKDEHPELIFKMPELFDLQEVVGSRIEKSKELLESLQSAVEPSEPVETADTAETEPVQQDTSAQSKIIEIQW